MVCMFLVANGHHSRPYRDTYEQEEGSPLGRYTPFLHDTHVSGT